jgi:hypothetical protein
MIRIVGALAVIGLILLVDGPGIAAKPDEPEPCMYQVSCGYSEIDAKGEINILARPRVAMLEGEEAVVETAAPKVELPTRIKKRLARTGGADRKWKITVLPDQSGHVLLDATVNLTDVESADESGVVLSTKGMRIIRTVPLDQVVAFEVPRGDGKLRKRIEFTVSEVERIAKK